VAHWTAERWAASSGIAFGIVLIVSNFLAGTPPPYNASSHTIVSFLDDHHRPLLVGSILGGTLIVLFLWCIASFAGMYREAGQNRLATIMYGAVVATVTLGAVGDAIGIAATQLRTTIDPSAVQTLYGVSFFFYLKLMWPLAALALATALATHRSKVLPRVVHGAQPCRRRAVRPGRALAQDARLLQPDWRDAHDRHRRPRCVGGHLERALHAEARRRPRAAARCTVALTNLPLWAVSGARPQTRPLGA